MDGGIFESKTTGLDLAMRRKGGATAAFGESVGGG